MAVLAAQYLFKHRFPSRWRYALWLPVLAMAAMLFHTFALHAADAPMPDFTKGDAIPAGAKHDWNLGATGLRGWMHTGETFSTTTARQIKITAVAEGSPGHQVQPPAGAGLRDAGPTHGGGFLQ